MAKKRKRKLLHRTGEETADILDDIYEDKFGGKRRGRYQISRGDLRKLAGRAALQQAVIDEIQDEVWEFGYIMIEFGDSEFAIVEESILKGYRKVPKSIINRYAPDYEDDEKENDKDE